jgi:hypothetical protein
LALLVEVKGSFSDSATIRRSGRLGNAAQEGSGGDLSDKGRERGRGKKKNN